MRVKIFICIFMPLVLFAQSRFIETDQSKLNRLFRDGPPELQSPLILRNSLLFFYYGEAKEVFLAGDFNQWALSIPMRQEKSNLWVASWTNRLPNGSYTYRFRVDGFWLPDPTNPNSVFDSGREELSVFELSKDFISDEKYPLWLSNNVYRFQYFNTNVKAVSIAGSFNNWNPFSHQMQYMGAGVFQKDITLDSKKIYLYSFVADGIWILDDGNKQQYRNSLGRPVNGFYADGSESKP